MRLHQLRCIEIVRVTYLIYTGQSNDNDISYYFQFMIRWPCRFSAFSPFFNRKKIEKSQDQITTDPAIERSKENFLAVGQLLFKSFFIAELISKFDKATVLFVHNAVTHKILKSHGQFNALRKTSAALKLKESALLDCSFLYFHGFHASQCRKFNYFFYNSA